ncbi:MAG: hypothetical protein B6U94_04550 [Thermofilum sp. ex4484_79]|nr:MAG: hypothetical protein B6U94_04550 [Thermofilum sp. ex4484_79]
MVVTVHYVSFHPTLIYDGFERIRLAYPVERVYLLYDGKQDKYGYVSKYNVRRLSRALSFFKPILFPVNPLSFKSVYSRMYSILKYEEESGRDVLIDITDMPSIMSSAVTVAVVQFRNAKIYSVQPESRGDFIPEPETIEFEEWVARKDNKRALELLGVGLPNNRKEILDTSKDFDKIRILKLLYNKGGKADSIKSLIKWSGEEVTAINKAQYSRWVSELEDKGLIQREYRGRNRRVILTELGKAYVEALRRVDEIKKKVTEIERKMKLPQTIEL